MATERLVIEINEKGARVVERNLKKIGSSSRGAEGSVQLLRRALGLLGGALVLTTAINTLATFSQEMSTVKAITQATEGQFKQLRDTAKDLGATTRFSATQAAEGMVFLGRAGFETNEILQSIEGTLQLAQAGALDLASAADIASNVLQGFRLETEETARVVDVLALAANSANTNVMQLGDAMKFVAPVAAGVGVSLEEATAAAAALSDAGLQASLAGTGLRRVLSELESPASKTIKLLQQLGLTADEVKISEVGLTQALETLKRAGIDTGLALEIFGDRGGPAFEVLTSSIPKVKELTAALQEADGTAERIAKTMDDNLNGALFAVKSATEAVIIAFGDFQAVDALTGIFRSFAEALRFVAKEMDTFGRIVNAVAIVLGVIFAKQAIGAAIAGLKLLSAAILANPLGALLVTVLSAIALLISFADRIKLTSDGMVSLKDFAVAAFETIGRVTSQIINSLIFLFDSLLGDSTRTFDQITGNLDFLILGFARAIDKIINFFQIGFITIEKAWENLPEVLGVIGVRAGNAVIRGVETGVNGAIDLLNFLPGVAIEPATFSRIKDDFEFAGSEFGQALGKALAERETFTGVEDTIKGVFDRAREIAQARLAEAGTGEEGGGGTGGQKQLETGEKINTQLARRIGFLKQITDRLDDEARLLGFSNREREIESELLKIKQQAETQNVKILDTDLDRLRVQLEFNQALQDQADLLNDIKGPQDEAAAQLEALVQLFDKGKISLDEFNMKFRELRLIQLEAADTFGDGFERALLKFQESADTVADATEKAFTSAFESANRAIDEFVQTGKLSLRSLFQDLSSQLLKSGTRQLTSNLLGTAASGISGFLQGGGPTGQGANVLGPPAPPSGGGGGFGSFLSSGLGQFASSLLAGQNGLDFNVNSASSTANLGAGAGVDNRLIAFRARDGERVSVTPKGEVSQRPVNVNFTVNTPDANSFKRSQGQILARTSAALQRANQKDN